MLSAQVFAQKSMRDSSVNFVMITPSLALTFPAADLAQRFGYFSTIGAKLEYKSRSNFIYGVNTMFHFGNRVKERSMLDNLRGPDGTIIGRDGRFGDLIFEMRGISIDAHLSKMLFNLGPNPNCGISVGAGLGFMQHRVKIRELNDMYSPIQEDYAKGYDRMTYGLLITESIYYRFFSNNRLINFLVGVDLNQGLTRGRRSYQFDLKQPYDQSRSDLSYALRLGWTFPIYKRAPKEFYYQ